jgi:hypothetical protein
MSLIFCLLLRRHHHRPQTSYYWTTLDYYGHAKALLHENGIATPPFGRVIFQIPNARCKGPLLHLRHRHRS